MRTGWKPVPQVLKLVPQRGDGLPSGCALLEAVAHGDFGDRHAYPTQKAGSCKHGTRASPTA